MTHSAAVLSSSFIATAGPGYLGLPLAVEFGKNYKVIGFDINPGLSLNTDFYRGYSPALLKEPGVLYHVKGTLNPVLVDGNYN